MTGLTTLRSLAPVFVVAGAVIGATAGACALLDEPSQCATDGDCVRFNAVCDVRNAVCVDRASVDGGANNPGDEGGGPGPADAADDSSPPLPPDCTVIPKPVANATTGLPTGPAVDGGVSAQVTANHMLGCDKDWLLDQHLVVGNGATLTIQPGTIIRAKKGSNAAIVVMPGGKIVAQGQRNGPIVFTVDDVAPRAGDWRGIFILGRAPRNGNNPYRGDPLLMYGGADAMDNSGSLRFVRVEYANDGVFLGGVGKMTEVESVQVRHSNDNCFVMNGGSFNAKHLICQQTFDEMFELQEGYTGHLQFVFGQKVSPGAEHNGMLIDGANTSPVISNVTLCGQNNAQNVGGHGLVFRNGSRLDMANSIIMGWLSGIDVQANPGAGPFLVRSTISFGNALNPTSDEDGGAAPFNDDDNGFDELGFFLDGGGNNRDNNPNVMDCHNANDPKPWPQNMINGRAPMNDGFFDVTATYVGAFKDANDNWLAGWTKFGP